MEVLSTAVRQQTETLINELCQGLYEREEPMKLALLSAIAGESIFLLGPPGVGKSLIARRLKYAFRDGSSFEYLMSRFSTPDEIFGPVSIKKLKEEDKYERLTDKYLPGANIVFLDEIWKSGPAIQNALLTILNEKIYRNGEQEVVVNIKGIITASNELPPDKESFQPLWDRFVLRYPMGGIRNQQNFLRMITDTQDVYEDSVQQSSKLSVDQLASWHKEIDEVTVPAEVLNTIQVVRAKLEAHNQKPAREIAPFRIYDRRWKKIIRLVRTSAFLNGRDKADLMDCFLMVHCLWNVPEQLELLQEIVGETVRKHGYSIAINLQMLRKEIDAFEVEVDTETRIKRVLTEDRLLAVQEEYYAFTQQEKQIHGDIVKIEDFNRLGTEDFEVINIYDKEQNLRHRLKARKSVKAHTLIISYNSQEIPLDLETTQVERTEIIPKKPHELVAAHWDERMAKLQTYVREQQERLSSELPDEFAGLNGNLFVPEHLSKLVMANLEEVREALNTMQLRLEKLQYAYTSL
ncbi:MAG: AAA family ATPase [Bacteroidota bacterium]